jgi:hypothetical protein
MAYLYPMKKVFITLVCLLFARFALAQKDSLQFDEGNNYVYYHVVDKAGLPADTLFARAGNFAARFNDQAKPAKGQAENTLNTTGKFIVYTGTSLVRKEAGEVSYTLNIQTKDQKYRYRISNFVFKPHQRDRYGNMALTPGIEVPLEKIIEKYGAKDAGVYLDQVGAFCINAAAKLKLAINKQPVLQQAAPVKKVTTTGNW